MKNYKHYSFDLWGTLLKPNPAFKEARTEYFFEHFNRKKLTHSQIESIFLQMADMHNTTAEVTGIGFTALELYTMVLFQMGYDLSTVQRRDMISIYLQMENLFLKFHPFLFNDVGYVLEKLKHRGATLSILSNTGFASGKTMRVILDKLEIFKFFQFPIFSDEMGMSKPNIYIFKRIEELHHLHNPFVTLPASEILHVGDSVKADINGANAAGLTGFGVHFNDITLRSLLQ